VEGGKEGEGLSPRERLRYEHDRVSTSGRKSSYKKGDLPSQIRGKKATCEGTPYFLPNHADLLLV